MGEDSPRYVNSKVCLSTLFFPCWTWLYNSRHWASHSMGRTGWVADTSRCATHFQDSFDSCKRHPCSFYRLHAGSSSENNGNEAAECSEGRRMMGWYERVGHKLSTVLYHRFALEEGSSGRSSLTKLQPYRSSRAADAESHRSLTTSNEEAITSQPNDECCLWQSQASETGEHGRQAPQP